MFFYPAFWGRDLLEGQEYVNVNDVIAFVFISMYIENN